MEERASVSTHVALGLLSSCALMFEILLTRIFSVTIWYHFAFVAISLAMFGLTAGALLVYLKPRWFPVERTASQMSTGAALFAAGTLATLAVHLAIPVSPSLRLSSLLPLAATFGVTALSFTCAGVSVCLALTRFPRQVGGLYAADLAGAALGCIGLLWLLDVSDGLTAVVGVATVAMASAVAFAPLPRARLPLGGIALAMAALVGVCITTSARGQPLLTLASVKGQRELPPLYEKWNSFSRFVIYDPTPVPAIPNPFGWGLSTTWDPARRVEQRMLTIDGTAGTSLTRWSGDPAQLDFLKYDVINVAHHLEHHADVLVLGVGGGRDLLSAIAFDQRSAVGVEMNGDILRAVTRRFGDFTGHLDRDPRITLVEDEARSWVRRQSRRFDLIQASLIDTWAATAAGAFALTENSLYTLEAWRAFLDHLTPNGIITFSRYYGPEAYRLVALATAALRSSGVAHPEAQLVVVGRPPVATLLAKRSPFTREELAQLAELATRMRFELLLAPGVPGDPRMRAIAAAPDLDAALAAVPVDLSPPTDDRPFFFHVVGLGALLAGGDAARAMGVNDQAMVVLATLGAIVLALTALCFLLPALLTRRTGATRPLVLFGSIGFGFMFVELSQMQHLNVFLGHPVYGLTVVLFTLLLSTGIGSLATRRFARLQLVPALATAALVLAAYGLVAPPLLRALAGSATPVRIVASVLLLFPAGCLMGMAFPLGMSRALAVQPELAPWLWATNGAASVCASVLAVILMLELGIGAALWTGVAFYLLALWAALSWVRS
jgi:hypothetical protein